MTAQIGNKYKYMGREYTFVRATASPSFSPREYGLEPDMACTACWSGYWCVYSVTEEGLFVEELYVHDRREIYPPIGGVEPFPGDYMGHRRYKGLHLKSDYTGKLLLGDDFLHEYYVHMGYQYPWAFKSLMEFVFEGGRLVETNDLSCVVDELRTEMKETPAFAKKVRGLRPFAIGEKYSEGLGEAFWWL